MSKKSTLKLVAILIAVFIGTSCKLPQSKIDVSDQASSGDASNRTYPKYAKGFRVKYVNDYKILELLDVQNPKNVIMRYYLVSRGTKHPTQIKFDSLVYVPVRKVAAFDSPQIGFLNALQQIQTICAVSGIKYVKNKNLKTRYQSGKLVDVGNSETLSLEKLFSAKPELVLASEFKNEKYEKIKKGGIKLAMTGDFLEESPLARAEWIKFIAYFFNQEKLAESLFSAIETRYLNMAEQAKKAKSKPSVFSASKFGSVWYVEGGKSYFAKFYEDAGASYVWSASKETASVALDFEKVYAKAADADYIRVNKNQQNTFRVKDLIKEAREYKQFKAVTDKHVIFCNSFDCSYYEDGTLQPDIILADLIKIFHPELSTNHKSVYYSLIQ